MGEIQFIAINKSDKDSLQMQENNFLGSKYLKSVDVGLRIILKKKMSP